MTSLRPVGPGDPPPPPDTRPAHERAREYLEKAGEAAYQDGNMAAILAVLGQAWATLALTEPPESVELEALPLGPACCTQEHPHAPEELRYLESGAHHVRAR
jgi:hypothetical protein